MSLKRGRVAADTVAPTKYNDPIRPTLAPWPFTYIQVKSRS